MSKPFHPAVCKAGLRRTVGQTDKILTLTNPHPSACWKALCAHLGKAGRRQAAHSAVGAPSRDSEGPDLSGTEAKVPCGSGAQEDACCPRGTQVCMARPVGLSKSLCPAAPWATWVWSAWGGAWHVTYSRRKPASGGVHRNALQWCKWTRVLVFAFFISRRHGAESLGERGSSWPCHHHPLPTYPPTLSPQENRTQELGPWQSLFTKARDTCSVQLSHRAFDTCGSWNLPSTHSEGRCIFRMKGMVLNI